MQSNKNIKRYRNKRWDIISATPLFIFLLSLHIKCRGQIPSLESISFSANSVRWERDIDSAATNPSSVIGFEFIDSCYSRELIERFDSVAPMLTGLRYVSIASVPCIGITKSIIKSMFKIKNINTIFDPWGEGFNSISINYPDTFRQNIVNLETRCPDSINCKEWQSRIYDFTNLNDLSLNFAKSTTIIPEITRLANLRGLQLFSLGDIQFPENFHEMKNLKEIDMSNCINCKSFPDQLPTSIEKINIFTTNISTLPSNLSDLRNLTHLNIACSKIKVFPKNFNFKQLHYFSAEESLFTPDEWERIKKDVFTVVTSCSSKGKSTLPKRG